MSDRETGFYLSILVGGLIFGFGLGYSHMARPEVVLDFLQFDDLGLLFVMGVAAMVTGVVSPLPRARSTAPPSPARSTSAG